MSRWRRRRRRGKTRTRKRTYGRGVVVLKDHLSGGQRGFLGLQVVVGLDDLLGAVCRHADAAHQLVLVVRVAGQAHQLVPLQNHTVPLVSIVRHTHRAPQSAPLDTHSPHSTV